MSLIAMDPAADARHRLGDRPHARESHVWLTQLPEHDVAVFVYCWVSGDHKAGGALVVSGPGAGEELVFERFDGVDVGPDADFDDWRAGPLTVRQGEPLKVADVAFAGERASVELRFEALHEPYAYGSYGRGCPKYIADERFEQTGRVRGVLHLDGREIEFDTTGHRDHSWGSRNWSMIQHWKWIVAQAGPDRVLHLMELNGEGIRHVWGYVLKDGALAAVTRFDTDFELDDDLFHRRLAAQVHDDAGRVTEVRFERFGAFPFPVSEQVTMHEVSMTTTIDSEPGIGHVEMGWPVAYLEQMRSFDPRP